MKKLFFSLVLSCLAISVSAQQEPDFVGEAVVVRADGTTQKLEKETVMLRSRANAGVFIVGIGSYKTKIVIDSPAAGVRLPASEPFRLIVKGVDNQTDPMAIIRIFALKATKKQRTAEIESLSTYGSHKSNKLKYLPFDAEKFGEKSYLITLREQPVGEYGITVSNPNARDEKTTIVSTFAIVEPL